MTAATAASPDAPLAPQAPRATAPGSPIRWSRLAWISYRQHRTGLIWVLGAYALVAIGMLPSGLAAHAASYEAATGAIAGPPGHLYGYYSLISLGPVFLQLLPLLGGLFLGAPLLAREAEHGTIALAWTQGADRTRWLLAKVIPIGALLALVSFALGFELRWWASAPWSWIDGWSASWFDLNPVPFAGWTLLAFALGVLAGGLTRRTLGGIGVTLGGYLALMFGTAVWLRDHYQPPLHQIWPMNGTGVWYSYSGLGSGWTRPLVTGPKVLSQTLAWPDGRLCDCWMRMDSWMTSRHIGLLTYYQPASRYQLFTYIEGGWLAVLAVLLLAATVLMIRHRSA